MYYSIIIVNFQLPFRDSGELGTVDGVVAVAFNSLFGILRSGAAIICSGSVSFNSLFGIPIILTNRGLLITKLSTPFSGFLDIAALATVPEGGTFNSLFGILYASQRRRRLPKSFNSLFGIRRS